MKKLFSVIVLIGLSLGKVSAFSDIQITDPLYMPTTYLSTIKIISGYDDGSFKPNNIINRAEALKLILVATDEEIKENEKQKFKDVPKDAWFAKYVNYAAEEGFVSGDGNTGLFVPDRIVNRAEFLKMLIKAFKIDTSKYVLNVVSKDVPDDVWFTSYLNFATKFEIMNRDENDMVYPDKALTRGEAVEMIFKMLKKGQGLDPQILLNLTEAHLLKTLSFLEEGNITSAGLVVTMAEKFAYTTSTILSVAKNKIVLGAIKTAESLKHLVGAYSAGENGRLTDVIAAAKASFKAADESLNLNPKNEEMINKIKNLASSLANKAREKMKEIEDKKTE